MAYIKPKFTEKEAVEVLDLLRRWQGIDTTRDRAMKKLEEAYRTSFVKAMRR
jgi:hypothetical protein